MEKGKIDIRDFLPKILLLGYRREHATKDGAIYWRILDSMSVIISVAVEADGKRWIHLSIAKADRLPTWDDLREAKNMFIGIDKKAIQVLPPEAEYVNFMPFCLHLFHCLDGDPIPEFSGFRDDIGGGKVRTL